MQDSLPFQNAVARGGVCVYGTSETLQGECVSAQGKRLVGI